MESPLISVVIPLFNKKDMIIQCISSAVNQTYDNLEVIVIDDGSTDGSSELAKTYNHCRLKYVLKDNGGVSSARNMGIRVSRGDYLVFLDADDYLLPDGIRILYRVLEEYQTKVAFGNFYVKNGDNVHRYCHSGYRGVVKHNFLYEFLKIYTGRQGSVLLHRSLFSDNHIFDESLSRYEDGEHTLYVMKNFRIAYTPTPVMVNTTEFHDLSVRKGNIQKDYISCMTFENRTLGEKLYLYKILSGAWSHYENEHDFLNQRYGVRKYVALAVGKTSVMTNLIMSKIFYILGKLKNKKNEEDGKS